MNNFLYSITTTTTIFLIFLCLYTTPSTAKGSNVLDVKGDKVLSNTSYYIIPQKKLGGGVGLFFNKTCPYFVAQEISEKSLGSSLRFMPKPVITKDQLLRDSFRASVVAGDAIPEKPEFEPMPKEINQDMTISIVFDKGSAKDECPKISKGWRVIQTKKGQVPARKYVKASGVISEKKWKTIWFQISLMPGKDPKPVYKIRYCPQSTKTNPRNPSCSDVGVVVDKASKRRLLVAGATDPLLVQFQKAKLDNTVSASLNTNTLTGSIPITT